MYFREICLAIKDGNLEKFIELYKSWKTQDIDNEIMCYIRTLNLKTKNNLRVHNREISVKEFQKVMSEVFLNINPSIDGLKYVWDDDLKNIKADFLYNVMSIKSMEELLNEFVDPCLHEYFTPNGCSVSKNTFMVILAMLNDNMKVFNHIVRLDFDIQTVFNICVRKDLIKGKFLKTIHFLNRCKNKKDSGDLTFSVRHITGKNTVELLNYCIVNKHYNQVAVKHILKYQNFYTDNIEYVKFIHLMTGECLYVQWDDVKLDKINFETLGYIIDNEFSLKTRVGNLLDSTVEYRMVEISKFLVQKGVKPLGLRYYLQDTYYPIEALRFLKEIGLLDELLSYL